MLATRAARTGAIDYSTTTREDAASLIREGLILRDIKREMLTTAFGTFDLAYTNPGERAFQYEFVKNAVPWLSGPRDDRSPEQRRIDELVEAWHQLEAMNKAKEAKENATEQTGLSE